MDKNTPVVQGYNLYVETVEKKLNSKNLDGDPLYALLGTKKASRKVLAGPYKSMRDLWAEMLETDLLEDDEFITQYGSLILCAATMDEDGEYNFDVDIAECNGGNYSKYTTLDRFCIQVYDIRDDIQEGVDIDPILNFFRYIAIHGKHPDSMYVLDRFIANAGDCMTADDCLVVKLPDMIRVLSDEDGASSLDHKYIIVGYEAEKDEEFVMTSPIPSVNRIVSMFYGNEDILSTMSITTFDQLRIKELSIDDNGNITPSTYVAITTEGINAGDDLSYRFAKAIVDSHYGGDWELAEGELGGLPRKPEENENEFHSSIKQVDEPVLYFITGEYNDRHKPSETLFTSDDPNQLANLILNAHGAARLFIKEYDSLAVGIAIDCTAFIKLAVFDKHQEDNNELATMAFTLAEAMTHAQLCMDGCKYYVDYEGFRDLTRLAALSFAGAKNEEMEETEDGE